MGRKSRRSRSAQSDRRQFEKQYSRNVRALRKIDLQDPQQLRDLVSRRGYEAFAPLPMEAHTARYVHAREIPDFLPETALKTIFKIPLVDHALSVELTKWPYGPDLINRRSWPEIVLWGCDQVANAFRLMRMGDYTSSAILARSQLEIWTLNVAQAHVIEPRDEESTEDYFRRCWQVYPHLADLVDPGEAWVSLSEFIHGRLYSFELYSYMWQSGSLDAIERARVRPISSLGHLISMVLDLTFHQVRAAASVLADRRGNERLASFLRADIEIVRSFGEPDGFYSRLYPVDYRFCGSRQCNEGLREGLYYRDKIRLAATRDRIIDNPSPGYGFLAITERRARAIEAAADSFRAEERLYGENFYPSSLDARLFRFIGIEETALVVASWEAEEEKDALTHASSALRSAWVLWLEDTDLAMASVRIVFEQTCRARAWRIKPQRAVRVASRPTPPKWLEAAGWKRVSILARALGEFSHTDFKSRYHGARMALNGLQDSPESEGILTARRNALETCAYMLAHEVATRLDAISETLGNSFRDAVTLLDKESHEETIESLLKRGHSMRDFDFGDPVFRRSSEGQSGGLQ